MLKFKKAHLYGGLFLLLSSCTKDRQKPIPTRELELYYQHEARWSDIPLILDFKPTSYEERFSTLIVKGTSMVPIDECFDFYKEDMERLGWKIMASFEVDHKLIVETPLKICLIELHEKPGKPQPLTSISVYCSAKNRSRYQ
jgi:hypothetical protein